VRVRERLRPADQRHGSQAPSPRCGLACQPGAAQPRARRAALRAEPAHLGARVGARDHPQLALHARRLRQARAAVSVVLRSRDRRWKVGENLAWGIGESSTPRSIVAAWMASAEHRKNILGRWTYGAVWTQADAPRPGLQRNGSRSCSTSAVATERWCGSSAGWPPRTPRTSPRGARPGDAGPLRFRFRPAARGSASKAERAKPSPTPSV
jgi:hypothetical protein